MHIALLIKVKFINYQATRKIQKTLEIGMSPPVSVKALVGEELFALDCMTVSYGTEAEDVVWCLYLFYSFKTN